MAKDVQAMKDELIGLRARGAALAERVDALEIAAGGLHGYKAPGKDPDARVVEVDRPDLAVVKLSPESGSDSDEPRQVIRSNGKGGTVIQEEAHGDDAGGLSGGGGAGGSDFSRAKDLFEKKNYADAATALNAFIKSSPSSDKVPDALLDLARSYDKLGDKDSADKARKRLKTDFPKSLAAKKLN